MTSYVLQDPNFYQKHGNYHYKILAGCVMFIICVNVGQFVFVMQHYDRNGAILDPWTSKNSTILTASRDNAKSYTSEERNRELWKMMEAAEANRVHSKELETATRVETN